MKTDNNQYKKHPSNFSYFSMKECVFDCPEAENKISFQAEKKARQELNQMEAKGLNADDLTYFVYRNYKAFGLEIMDEDARYNFILDLRSVMEKICRDYNPEESQLFHYLKCCIKLRQRNENRKLARIAAKESAVMFDSGNDLIIKETADPYQSFYTQIEKETFAIPKNLDEKTIKRLPSLALKSSWYLTDEIIEKLCIICSLEKEKFIKIVEKLNQKIEKRIMYTEKYSRQLISVYSKQLSYQYELQKLTCDNSPYKTGLKKRLKNRMKTWKKFDLYKKGLRISTPVQLIAEALNRPVNEIENDLRYFKRNIEKFMHS